MSIEERAALFESQIDAALAKNYAALQRWGILRPWRNQRPPVPQAIRRAVLARDGERCQQCASSEEPELDHVVPWSLGGRHEESNLRVLCGPCNRRRWIERAHDGE